jgi:hypothetical protein
MGTDNMGREIDETVDIHAVRLERPGFQVLLQVQVLFPLG